MGHGYVWAKPRPQKRLKKGRNPPTAQNDFLNIPPKKGKTRQNIRIIWAKKAKAEKQKRKKVGLS